MKAEWIQSQTYESISSLWRMGVFQKIVRSSFTPQDCVRKIVSSCFHHMIKRKGGDGQALGASSCAMATLQQKVEDNIAGPL